MTTSSEQSTRGWRPFSWDSWSITFCRTPPETCESSVTQWMSASRNALKKWRMLNLKWKKISERYCYQYFMEALPVYMYSSFIPPNLFWTLLQLINQNFFSRCVMKFARWRRTLICLGRQSEIRKIQWRFLKLASTTAHTGLESSSAVTQYNISKEAFPEIQIVNGYINRWCMHFFCLLVFCL